MGLLRMIYCSIRNHPEKVFITGKDSAESKGCLATYECPHCEQFVDRYYAGKKLEEVLMDKKSFKMRQFNR